MQNLAKARVQVAADKGQTGPETRDAGKRRSRGDRKWETVLFTIMVRKVERFFPVNYLDTVFTRSALAGDVGTIISLIRSTMPNTAKKH